MPVIKKSHPALKHGGYAKTAVFPGESLAEFEKLGQSLVDEYAPQGAHENDIISTMTRLIWRKQNRSTFRKADYARRRRQQLMRKKVQPQFPSVEFHEIDPSAREEAIRDVEDELRKELGVTYELLELGEEATGEGVMKDLEVQDRFDSMIDKCIKRFAIVRAFKSTFAAPSSAPPKLLPGPSKAA